MKTRLGCIVIGSLFAAALPALAAPKDDVAKAIKALAESPNYTWKSSWQNSQFNMGPTIGKINKDGLAVVTREFNNNTAQSVIHGDKAAAETQDGWQSLEELENSQGQGMGRFAAMMLRNFESAAEEAESLLKSAAELSVVEGVIQGDLTKEGAEDRMSFRRRRGGGQGQGPEISNASGSVKFWIENGMLKKYQYHVAGTMSWNGNDRDMDRTMVIEISDVGNTKVEVPEGAKAKL